MMEVELLPSAAIKSASRGPKELTSSGISRRGRSATAAAAGCVPRTTARLCCFLSATVHNGCSWTTFDTTFVGGAEAKLFRRQNWRPFRRKPGTTSATVAAESSTGNQDEDFNVQSMEKVLAAMTDKWLPHMTRIAAVMRNVMREQHGTTTSEGVVPGGLPPGARSSSEPQPEAENALDQLLITPEAGDELLGRPDPPSASSSRASHAGAVVVALNDFVAQGVVCGKEEQGADFDVDAMSGPAAQGPEFATGVTSRRSWIPVASGSLFRVVEHVQVKPRLDDPKVNPVVRERLIMFLLPLHLDHVLGTTTTSTTPMVRREQQERDLLSPREQQEGEKTKVADLFASLDDRLRPMLLAVALEDRVMTSGERVPLLASMQHLLSEGEVRVHAAVQANYDAAGAVYPKVFRYNTTIGSTGTDGERGGEQNYQPALTVDRGWYDMWESLVAGAVASLKESDDELVKASRLQSMSNTSHAPATTMSTPRTTSTLTHGDPVAAGYGLYPLQPRGLMFAPVVRGALDPLDKHPLQKLLTLEAEAAKEGPAAIEKKSRRPTNSISEQDEKAEQIDVETTPKTFTWWTTAGSAEDGEHTGQVESTASAPAGRSRPHPAVKSMALLLPLRFVMRRNVIANRSGSSDAAGAVDAMTSSVSEGELFQHFKDAILSKQVIAKLDSKLSEHGTSLYRLYQELPATFDFSSTDGNKLLLKRLVQAATGKTNAIPNLTDNFVSKLLKSGRLLRRKTKTTTTSGRSLSGQFRTQGGSGRVRRWAKMAMSIPGPLRKAMSGPGPFRKAISWLRSMSSQQSSSTSSRKNQDSLSSSTWAKKLLQAVWQQHKSVSRFRQLALPNGV